VRNSIPQAGPFAALAGLAISLALSFAAQPAAAAVITSLDGGVARDMPVLNRFGSGEVSFADGVTYESLALTGGGLTSAFGYTGSYTFPDGTNWGGGTPFAAIGLSTGIMSFTFDDPVAAVLAEFIWARAATSFMTFSAYNASGALLEQLTFRSDDPAHPKGFLGFQHATNDISRFDIQGYYFGARNLSTLTSDTAAVPEPATWAMLILGFAGVGSAVRRRRLMAPA